MKCIATFISAVVVSFAAAQTGPSSLRGNGENDKRELTTFSAGDATFFRDAYYQGPRLGLPAGRYNYFFLLGKGFDDAISSMRVDHGFSVKLCRHPNFRDCFYKKSDEPWFGPDNDVVSSLEILKDSIASGCCDPADKPDGRDGKPTCLEGATCCPNGSWVCNSGNGNPSCAGEGPPSLTFGVGRICENSCDPADKPDGRNGKPTCFEGATCCPSGSWACNSGNGSSSCSQVDDHHHFDDDDDLNDDHFDDGCDPEEKPDGRNGKPTCIEGATCCPSGSWACNSGNGNPSGVGGICENSCDPADKPDGRNGKPTCFEGATCCADGAWACNSGNGSPSC